VYLLINDVCFHYGERVKGIKRQEFFIHKITTFTCYDTDAETMDVTSSST